MDAPMPKIVDKDEKSQLIADVALKVFRRRGFTRTRMADIAEAAGIGKGTIYEYFKSKTDMLQFAFDQYFEVFADGALKAMADAAGPAQKLIALIDFSFEHIAQWEDHCTAYLSYISSEGSGTEKVFSLDSLYDTMDQLLVALIREGQAAGEIDPGIEPSSMARLFICIYDGVILHRLFENKATDRKVLHQAARALLAHGLFGPKHEKVS
jgi:AcrR family transcriptional regulator